MPCMIYSSTCKDDIVNTDFRSVQGIEFNNLACNHRTCLVWIDKAMWTQKAKCKHEKEKRKLKNKSHFPAEWKYTFLPFIKIFYTHIFFIIMGICSFNFGCRQKLDREITDRGSRHFYHHHHHHHHIPFIFPFADSL